MRTRVRRPGRSFGCCRGGPEFGKPLLGWQQDDREDHTETEDSRGHRKGHGVPVGGRDRRRQRPRVVRGEVAGRRGQRDGAQRGDPIDPPTCCMVLTSAEATPESWRGTPAVAVLMAGAKIMPKPRPRMSRAGSTLPA